MKKRGRPRKKKSLRKGPIKYIWSKEEIAFLKRSFKNKKMTNAALADELRLTLTMVRMKCYSLGLRRMELEYWTVGQVKFLKANYKKIGDKELAEIFNKKWKKGKGWSFKHIEKKRRYLALKRSEKQIKAIHQRNVDNGRFLMCPVKRWLVTGVAKEGEIRMWRSNSGRIVPMIKINGKFVHWGRWAWEKQYGKVAKGKNVVFKDGNPYNISIENLEDITDAELSRRNSKKSSQGLSDNYVAYTLSYKDPEMRKLIKQRPDLIELKRQQLKLKRSINEHSKDRQ